MKEIICDISAFRLYRVPPQILMQCPPFPSRDEDRNRHFTNRHILTKYALGVPLHVGARAATQRTGASSLSWHVIPEGIPPGHIYDTQLGVCVTSPELTLFQLSQRLPEPHAIMAMYEMCGTYAVFHPTEELDALTRNNLLPPGFGWKRVADAQGRPSNLWQRDPLTTLARLEKFAQQIEGTRGQGKFSRAIQYVSGITASPFETQTSMLFALPRHMGGEGFPAFSNNEKISLTKEARLLTGKSNCYADIVFDTSPGKTLIVECQGKLVHNTISAAVLDSDRTTALQQMGFDVLLLTYSQIAHTENFDIIRRIIAERIGMKYRDKTSRQLQREKDLRHCIFLDWGELRESGFSRHGR